MSKFKKVAIIGVGLIGGSVALAIKKKHLARSVIGVFRHRATLRRALKSKAIDRGVLDIYEGVKDADLIVVATPVVSIPEMVEKTAAFTKTGAIITDVGSTKRWVVDSVEKMPVFFTRKVFFVGSHPMAGSEKTGVEFARSSLLEDTPCIVTPTARTDRKALKKIIGFWSSLGADVTTMSPAVHDRRVANISHLPHLLAFSMAGAVPKDDLNYAAEGFKDTTRVASSDPELWADIFLTNAQELISACRAFEGYYREILEALAEKDRPKVIELLTTAKAQRDRLLYGK